MPGTGPRFAVFCSWSPDKTSSSRENWLRRNDLSSTALLLQRHTGMRIAECADLSLDGLRPLGPDQWAILVPLGKLKTERLIPVDSFVCQLVARLRALRAQDAPPKIKGFLVSPALSRQTLIRDLRATLHQVAAAVGITTRIVPHQLRYIRHRNAPCRRQLPRRHEIAWTYHPTNGYALRGNHPGGSTTRVSVGTLSSSSSPW